MSRALKLINQLLNGKNEEKEKETKQRGPQNNGMFGQIPQW